MNTRKTVNVTGFELYAPDSAPKAEWICAHWSDHHIAVSFQEHGGQWWRGQGGSPTMEKATASLVGWVPITRAL